ncbi:MAG: glycosyltransferase [Arhodomonas sp.]|nr:glycosyltransferase [Arhodomonas sp.]
MNRRVAILTPLKDWGGIERKMLILCREFVAQGVEVEFILTRGGQVPYPDEFPKQVHIVDLRSKHKYDAIPRLIRHLRRSRPAALLTAKDHAAKVAVLARILGRLDVRVIVKVTSTLSETLRRSGKHRFAQWLYPRANGIIAISQGVKADMVRRMGMPAERIHVVYNPMVTPDMAERARNPTGHLSWNKDDHPVILSAGRLTPGKGFSPLMEAFAELRRQRRCRLVILGEGPERSVLEQLAEDLGIAGDVLLPGYQRDPIPWMARAAVFALASRYEGLGNVLVEAMAVGTPVVSTDCPSGPAEILENGRYGPLVPVGDVAALTAALGHTLDDPIAAEVLRRGAERFHSTAIANQYLAVLGVANEHEHAGN